MKKARRIIALAFVLGLIVGALPMSAIAAPASKVYYLPRRTYSKLKQMH